MTDRIRQDEARIVNLLLVEDNDADAQALEEILSRETYFRYQIQRVRSFEETAYLLKENNGQGGKLDAKFDILFLDLSLPNGAGVDLVVRTREICDSCILILWTGMQNDKEETEVLEAFADEYLVKGDHNPEELRKIVRKWAIRFKARKDRLQATCEIRQIGEGFRQTIQECERDPKKPPYDPDEISTKDTQKTKDTILISKKKKKPLPEG